jgi:hypothetical protein
LLAVETFSREIWEPACGDGAISKVLEEAGHEVLSTDLVDRGYGDGGLDFVKERHLALPTIITNPPFKLAEQFVIHALDLGAVKMAFLLRLAWLEGEGRRRRIFSQRPPARIWVLSSRPTLWNGDDPGARTTGGAISYAWFIWDRDAPAGPPTLGWLQGATSGRK